MSPRDTLLLGVIPLVLACRSLMGGAVMSRNTYTLIDVFISAITPARLPSSAGAHATPIMYVLVVVVSGVQLTIA